VPLVAQAQSARQQLEQLVQQLQSKPDDNALRAKIIKSAQDLKPAPAIPEEARRHFVRAVTLQKDAQKPEDYDLPIKEYRQALLLAPWWSDAYFDLASALELKQEYPEAIQNLKLSLLANPEGPDARTAQDRTYALEAKQEKLTKDKLEQEALARAEEAKYGWMLGRWRFTLDGGYWTADGAMFAKRLGDQVEFKITQGTSHSHNYDTPFDGRDMKNALLRATIMSSGEIIWEAMSYFSDYGCPVRWFAIAPNIRSDHRTISFEHNTQMGRNCNPTTPEWRYTLSHE
jgi:tetratricopeptide (TPR) repeat protein